MLQIKLSNSGTWQNPLIFLGLCFPALLLSSRFVNCSKCGCWLQRRTTWKWVCVFLISGWHSVQQNDGIGVTHCSITEAWEHVTQDEWHSQQCLGVSRILSYNCLLLSALQLEVSWRSWIGFFVPGFCVHLTFFHSNSEDKGLGVWIKQLLFLLLWLVLMGQVRSPAQALSCSEQTTICTANSWNKCNNLLSCGTWWLFGDNSEQM